ncbi:MAG: hypothetical protein R2939_15530 [Kofleriaceae bacterium]
MAAAATAAAVGIWPILMKVLMGFLKGLLAGRLKDRAKKKQKVRLDQRSYRVMGMNVRPREVLHLTIGALVYGFAVYYAMFGWSLRSNALGRQETLVFMFGMVRLVIRYVYERIYGIVSEYRFWAGGGVLALGSAYMGNALNTVGFELNTAQTDEEKRRMLKLSVVMILVSLGLAVVFFLANRSHPTTFFQCGVLASTGSCLTDMLPAKPMTGQKIWAESKLLYAGLAALVLPAFFLLNFVL